MVAKRILQLGGGLLMKQSVVQIKQMGHEVYVVDKNPKSPAFEIADGFEAIDIIKFQEVYDYAAKIKADVILAVSDAGVYAAAWASKKLGLLNHDPEDVKYFTDKGYMRLQWQKAGLSQPDFIIVEDKSKLRQSILDFGLPLILKPCLNWGSRGVSLINNEDEIDIAIDFATSSTLNSRYIIEDFITGTEMTIEGLVQYGNVTILAKSDKVAQEHNRFRVAMELNYPANFNKEILGKTDELIKAAAKFLNINLGAIHAECMVNDNGIYLIEMAGKPGGGHIFGVIVSAVSGVSMPQALVKILLNQNVEFNDVSKKGCCYRFFRPPKGIFNSIENLEIAGSQKGILDIGFSMQPGTIVGDIAGDADRPGFIVASGTDRDDAVENANYAESLLKFNIR